MHDAADGCVADERAVLRTAQRATERLREATARACNARYAPQRHAGGARAARRCGAARRGSTALCGGGDAEARRARAPSDARGRSSVDPGTPWLRSGAHATAAEGTCKRRPPVPLHVCSKAAAAHSRAGAMMKIPCKHPEKGPMMYEARPTPPCAARQRRLSRRAALQAVVTRATPRRRCHRGRVPR